VADDDAFGADEDVFDDQAQYALLLGGGRGAGVAAEPGEEAFEVVGELEVGVAVGELGGQGAELAAQAELAGAESGHTLPQFVEGDQLFLVGLDQPGDRGGAFAQCLLEALLPGGGGVGGAQLLQPPVDLGPDQLRAGEQAGDVVPDDLVEVVGADGLVVADAAVFVAVVVGAQAPVVVDLVARGGGGVAAVVGVSAARTRGQALQQGGTLELRAA
jgi:hypothetical protein